MPGFRNYLTFYRIAAGDIQILCGFHAARNFESTLEDEISMQVISIFLHIQAMEMPIDEEMNMLCQRYDGLSRAANRMEQLTEGSISVPG